jgi:hypothetical protein
MRGSYKYAPVKVVLAQIIPRDNDNKKSNLIFKDILFVDGDYYDGNIFNIRF